MCKDRCNIETLEALGSRVAGDFAPTVKILAEDEHALRKVATAWESFDVMQSDCLLKSDKEKILGVMMKHPTGVAGFNVYIQELAAIHITPVVEAATVSHIHVGRANTTDIELLLCQWSSSERELAVSCGKSI